MKRKRERTMARDKGAGQDKGEISIARTRSRDRGEG